MKTAWLVGLAAIIAGSGLSAQTPDSLRGRLSNDGVLRASVVVDSVFLDRTKLTATIDGGDWASYLLARLGAGRIPGGLGIEVVVDTVRILVRGRLQDLPPETRGLLGPVASMVDSSTMIVADVASCASAQLSPDTCSPAIGRQITPQRSAEPRGSPAFFGHTVIITTVPRPGAL